jgi:outer membrane lipoprotein-sorting protein
MRKLLLPLLLLPLAFEAHAAEFDAAERAALLARLTEIRAHQPAATARFREERVTRLLQRPVVTEGTVHFQAPDKFRREIAGEHPSLTVSDGKTLWISYPGFHEAEKYTLGQRGMFDQSIAAVTAGLNFENVERFYRFRAFREEKSVRIELEPARPDLRRVLQRIVVWMEPRDLLLEKTVLTLPSGDQVTTVYTGTRRLALPPDTFTFEPPAGTRVTTPLGR